MRADRPLFLALALALAATTAPSLLAWNVSPSATFLNQALALLLWGLFVAASGPLAAARVGAGAAGGKGLLGLNATQAALNPLAAALALLATAVGLSWALRGLPGTLAWSALGMLAAAAVVAAAGARAATPPAFRLVAWGLVAAGVVNTGIAALQVFAPGWADSSYVARSGFAGRAVGNLRQPNHLSSLLMWGCIGVVALVEMRRLAQRWAWPLLGLMVVAVVLTASRTGLVSVLLLALWGGLDRRLARPTRTLLLLAPLFYALAWLALDQWATATQHSFGGSARLAETDISSSRFAIWGNTLSLIAQQPWAGVGWGGFNFAWTLTPFPGRPVAFFDHTHNLPLQLAVELGLPLGSLVLGLLLWALWRAARAAWGGVAVPLAPGLEDAQALNTAQRCAVMVVLMIGLHSLLEYPLWYAYFLLPTAWCWGFALAAGAGASSGGASDACPSEGTAAQPRPAPPGWRPWLQPAAGLALALGAVLAVADYTRVVAVFRATPGAAPLAQRIAKAQRSLFFGHHADYAALTSGLAFTTPADQQAAFARATRHLLDTRLMVTWARARAAAGDEDGARHLAARLREFRNPAAKSFFEVCEPAAPAEPAAEAGSGVGTEAAPATGAATAPSGSFADGLAPPPRPFQCAPPQRVLGWRHFQGPADPGR